MKSGVRPGRGTGVSGADLFRPSGDRPSDAESIPDERRDKTFCKACGKEVQHVKVGERWSVRDLDNIPHALTCGD
jgi:hypothetical protein